MCARRRAVRLSSRQLKRRVRQPARGGRWPQRQNWPVAWDTVADYVRSLGLDAWMVGGAVRDEILGKPIRDTDFVVPGIGHPELRTALAPHGRVEDLVVAGQSVGVRLIPRDR